MLYKSICGIYAIVNKINGKQYIGSSKSIHNRWINNHLPTLKSGNHFNRHLQSAWNKYGGNNFELQLIEECKELKLPEREGYWIEKKSSWKREYGYNLTRIIDNKQVLNEESIFLRTKHINESKQIENYWTTGMNGSILKLFNEGTSKNAIANKLHITRSEVYSCLEHNGLHKNEGKGSVVKLTDETKNKIQQLRNKDISWKEITEQTGISKTQLYRSKTAKDGKYGSTKVNRKTYRTVTPKVVKQVEELRKEGKNWEEIETVVGVSRFALHANGITQTLKCSRKGKTGKKVTDEMREKVINLLQKYNITEISHLTGVPKSTIRLIRKKHNENQKKV